MELKEIKQKINFITAIPTENRKLKEWLLTPEDCFGRGYSDDNKYCKECNAAAELDGRREQLKVFCREFVEEGKVTKLQTKLELLRALRERKVSNG